MHKPFCAVPFVEAFMDSVSTWRNCCVASPQIVSADQQSFVSWWNGAELEDFRKKMWTQDWIPECHRCQIQEQHTGHSFRTAVNQTTDAIKAWPQRWNIKFGNTCNLSCWTCGEKSSSVIAQHKKRINILPADWQDPEPVFEKLWPSIKQNILESYNYYDVITLTLTGGEPLYNPMAVEFLAEIKSLGLAPRTRLEFHTNATRPNNKLLSGSDWNHICMFLSIDAVGKKAEWLRYGSRWNKIEKNIDFFKQIADYVEIHCTLSILNLADLPALKEFCNSQGIALQITVLTYPDFMSLLKWPGDPDLITDLAQLQAHGFENYYNLVGSQADASVPERLKSYIQQFDTIRNPLKNYDPKLAQALNL